jgi:ribosomal protein L12E/L44/L45/RPP1/RPP2
MADLTIPEDSLRALLKQALIEALEERRDLLHDVVVDALEEIALAEAIREGRRGEVATRDEVFAALKSEA